MVRIREFKDLKIFWLKIKRYGSRVGHIFPTQASISCMASSLIFGCHCSFSVICVGTRVYRNRWFWSCRSPHWHLSSSARFHFSWFALVRAHPVLRRFIFLHACQLGIWIGFCSSFASSSRPGSSLPNFSLHFFSRIWGTGSSSRGFEEFIKLFLDFNLDL